MSQPPSMTPVITPPKSSAVFNLPDAQATRALGARLAGHMRAGDVLALRGGLGAGKTTLVRGFLRALLDDELEVPSPTYTLVQVYEGHEIEGKRCEIWHGDMYRLERPQDGEELGLWDAFEDAICLIEWPDKLGDYWPEDALNLQIEFDGESRKAVLSGPREWIDDV